ncbi:MAG: transporter substrate-binding domain-containing protein, partial [Micrococcaceae bacterium]|nr:transporter substrate-binding domain-containing protein [Micrococcaceae bacterium]
EKAIDMQFFPTQNDANLALTSGRVQGVMADSVSLAYQGGLAGGKFELAEGPDYEPVLTATALGKGSDLLPAIQAATKVVLESPAYGEMNTKWELPASTVITPADVVLK